MSARLIIIGAGPGGYETALFAARRGFDVTLVEAGEVGGTCLNEGCIPTKAFCRTAALLSELSDAGQFGVGDVSFSFDFSAVAARKNAVVEQLRGGVLDLIAKSKIRLVKGRARFAGGLSVEVGGERYEADDIIIATGSVPSMLPIPGAGLPGVLTSKEMLDTREVPKRLCVVGGGVIGLEFASVFKAFGSEVTVVEYAKEVLPHFDTDLAKRLRQSLGKRGINIETQTAVTSVSEEDGALRVSYVKKGRETVVDADKVLMAVGRRANVDSLNLADIGVEFTKNGIAVDENMRTNIPHIYAIGDINGRMMLAHAATFQGIRALNAIAGLEDGLNLDVMPAAVFTMPEAASVGMTEDNCKEQGIGYTCRKAFFRANGKAVCMGETDGFCKLVVAADGKLLGCHVYGAHASDLIQEACALITAGASADALSNTIHAHPTLGEVLQTAVHS